MVFGSEGKGGGGEKGGEERGREGKREEERGNGWIESAGRSWHVGPSHSRGSVNPS